MIIIFILICVCLLNSMNISWKGINEQYLSKENTSVIKGVFILFVFMSHIRGYADFTNKIDNNVLLILDYFGQLMVALFLFYSGYGVFESIKRKPYQYINSFPTHRIVKTFLDFSFAIMLFWLLSVCIGVRYSIYDVILSLTGWRSIGNSNWYMFAIFTLYIMTYFVFRLMHHNNFKSLCMISIGSIIYVLILSEIQPTRFSNTYLCYIVGMWYSYFKENIDIILKKNNINYYVITCLILILYLSFYSNRGINIFVYNITAILFSLLIVYITLKFNFSSQLLSWFGKHLFWIYIIQRIPMIFFNYLGLSSYPYVFLLLSFIFTVLFANYLQIFTSYLKNRIL